MERWKQRNAGPCCSSPTRRLTWATVDIPNGPGPAG
nr:MAG TPA: hypothetical protein [Caudoviricetes sp.]